MPRMWGGETNAAELRRIADVVDKYQIPTVKVTGGQRIDLLGVKKEDLRGVWRDLDMPSRPRLRQGAAHREDLRRQRVVPLRHAGLARRWARTSSARCGACTRRTRSSSPCRGCPRNCAEAGIKDVGVIGVDSGWEIYVAGNGGIKTEVAQFLVKVKTADEVLEYTGAFLQLYREEGWYLERTVHYVHRVGLDYVKKARPGRRRRPPALWERLQFALDGEPDPWFELEQGRASTRGSSSRGDRAYELA